MNLFLNPSLREFRKLFGKGGVQTEVHHVVLDYDGEVLVDPQLEQPDLDLKKFKVHVQLRSLKPLHDLFQYLMNAWNEIDNESPFQLPMHVALR
jgi:hypothetical protein